MLIRNPPKQHQTTSFASCLDHPPLGKSQSSSFGGSIPSAFVAKCGGKSVFMWAIYLQRFQLTVLFIVYKIVAVEEIEHSYDKDAI
ncbi:hypothetical protein CDAR_77661 [Caerostris darwini]|uniref:Uncharacterized protein n=1 Tax=Caerostris darwini TaxID=1538125 RepID=A0AAV4V4U5_9ARAC|nr:hypothetical protein CDAR_77661 [Caerostris darwini]